MEDGMINPGDNKFGFIPDKFEGYLWKQGPFIWISFIESLQPGKGNLRHLFDKIEELGYKIIVPTPFPRMQKICEQRGMKLVSVRTEDDELCEAMVRTELRVNEYECAICGKVFQKGQSDEDAAQEQKETFGDLLENKPMATLCDHCYKNSCPKPATV